MSENPYEPPKVTNILPEDLPQKKWGPLAVRIFASALGIGLFATNPFRDLWFYSDVAAHEGFGTTNDTFIIGFAHQLMATIFFFPVAVILIGYGIGRSQRLTVIPRTDQFTWGWGLFASLVAVLMLLIEVENVYYCIRFRHHFDTLLLSTAYLGFIYFWWCCSLTHGSPKGTRLPCQSERILSPPTPPSPIARVFWLTFATILGTVAGFTAGDLIFPKPFHLGTSGMAFVCAIIGGAFAFRFKLRRLRRYEPARALEKPTLARRLGRAVRRVFR